MIDLNINTYRKKRNSFINDFTKDLAQGLFNQEKLNDTLCELIQTALNELLESELTAFLGYDPYERDGWNSGNSRNGAYYRKINTQFGEKDVKAIEADLLTFYNYPKAIRAFIPIIWWNPLTMLLSAR